MSGADTAKAQPIRRSTRIRQLYWSGMSPADIATGLGISDEAVEAVLFTRIAGAEVERPVFLLIETRDDNGEPVLIHATAPIQAPTPASNGGAR